MFQVREGSEPLISLAVKRATSCGQSQKLVPAGRLDRIVLEHDERLVMLLKQSRE